MDLPGITRTGPLFSRQMELERTALHDGLISISMIISVILHKLLFVRFKENSCSMYSMCKNNIACQRCLLFYYTVKLHSWAKLD
jgi:hypothetical protein